MSQVLILTPPFTQLNTPYPATAYLKGYLNTLGIKSAQADLGINVINKLFTKSGLSRLFDNVTEENVVGDNAKRIWLLKVEYIAQVDRVMNYLKEPTVDEAQLIVNSNVLPESGRFSHLNDEIEAFGTMGLLDRAKHYSTLFLEDLSDFIIEVVDANFGFSRYAERLGRSAASFDEIYSKLNKPLTLVEQLLIEELSGLMLRFNPELVLLSVPFPGNLFSAFRIGQWLKANYSDVKISMGGGFVNTELRDLSDARVFEFCDFITLDDGEMPIRCLWEYLKGQREVSQLKRTFLCQKEEVYYLDGAEELDVHINQIGTPDYSDVEWGKYISVLEVANPMFRLWSDGQWLKLTLAHGCYWGKCAFCDGSLDYIGRYQPCKVDIITDRMEALMKQTGKRGFHFVDEAAPPALLKDLALEILRRKLNVVWWTNIRFEKNFTADLCLLLKQSGCIAVAGGLEVASARVLKMINKGVSIEQVTNVTSNLSQAGIMIHAYLMYGFPTQTAQETIDSLEVVRQLFELGVVNSGFWHQFALTAHSPVGRNAHKYNVEITKGLGGTFAINDLEFVDKQGTTHAQYSEGLKKALYNYMHGVGFDFPLSDWFEFKVPRTTLPPGLLEGYLNNRVVVKDDSRVLWLGHGVSTHFFMKKKGKKQVEMAELTLVSTKSHLVITTKVRLGKWLVNTLKHASFTQRKLVTFRMLQEDYEDNKLGDFDVFIGSYTFSKLKESGLIIV
ncbi:B12-binding domain-containing radical SAM protein [Carboxylicivirga marina]|uniref:Radical SAM protein n=1 Tax=Carboxylicivirga marina TaxID=2800988 RepID=A0ABS1HMZ5_9BACT|nr:radical SAM protein [Carboxylicivirga marina]MBK3519054.1 radical SAM protein [Carboxylicivirga marina]